MIAPMEELRNELDKGVQSLRESTTVLFAEIALSIARNNGIASAFVDVPTTVSLTTILTLSTITPNGKTCTKLCIQFDIGPIKLVFRIILNKIQYVLFSLYV